MTKFDHVMLFVVGLVTFCLVALPTCVAVSSWHVWWGVFITIPVCALGFTVQRIVVVELIKRNRW